MGSRGLWRLCAMLSLASAALGFAPGMEYSHRRRSAPSIAASSSGGLSGDDAAPNGPCPLAAELATNMLFARARLEREHTLSIIRRKPRFLAYGVARLWAQRLGLASQQEWDDWIALGEKRNGYIPSSPEARRCVAPRRRRGAFGRFRVWSTAVSRRHSRAARARHHARCTTEGAASGDRGSTGWASATRATTTRRRRPMRRACSPPPTPMRLPCVFLGEEPRPHRGDAPLRRSLRCAAHEQRAEVVVA